MDQRTVGVTGEGIVFSGEPGQNQRPRDVGEDRARPSAFDEAGIIGARISDAFEAIAGLESRLAPVLGPPVPRQPVSDVEESSSTLVAELRRAIVGLQELRVSIDLLTSRLEV